MFRWIKFFFEANRYSVSKLVEDEAGAWIEDFRYAAVSFRLYFSAQMKGGWFIKVGRTRKW